MKAAAQRVVLSLGANLGDRHETLRSVCRALEQRYGCVACSNFYETEPVNCPAGSPPFLNACVAFDTSDSPQEVLHHCQQIEQNCGRTRSGIYGEPRLCDIDIIDYAQRCYESAELTLPHPRAHERDFVLRPLSDIEPQLILPRQSLSVAQLLQQIQQN